MVPGWIIILMEDKIREVLNNAEKCGMKVEKGIRACDIKWKRNYDVDILSDILGRLLDGEDVNSIRQSEVDEELIRIVLGLLQGYIDKYILKLQPVEEKVDNVKECIEMARGIKLGEARAVKEFKDIVRRVKSGEDAESIRQSGVNEELLESVLEYYEWRKKNPSANPA